MLNDRTIAVIGLGYVGLPVAVAFGAKTPVIGFDINPKRIHDLRQGTDITGEVSSLELNNASIHFTTDIEHLKGADFYIVTVPTPSDGEHKPDLQFLHQACEIVGSQLNSNDIVVFESTVYPGATQEVCIPRLERASTLKAGVDFSVGYSPERISPGDKDHTFNAVTKVVSAQDAQTLDTVAEIYAQVVQKGIYRASSIKVAEAAKIVENTQRDLNISLMNELAIICERLKIDTLDVIETASSKWNFMPFKPGLVGGHCIGVDPYYLTYKAKQLGYRPEVILAGRRINDGMGKYVADQTVKQLIHQGVKIKGARVGILGLTFKENCRDLRNSKVIDVINELESFGVVTYVHDPLVTKEEVLEEYDLELTPWEAFSDMDALVLCVAHQAYCELEVSDFADKFGRCQLIIDVKAMLDRESIENAGITLWRL